MSVEENIEAVKRGVEALNNGDLRTIMNGYTDDIVWHIGTGAAEESVSYFGTWKGKSGLMTSFSLAFKSPVQETHFELTRHYGVGDRVFSFGQASYVDITTGKEFTTPQAYESVFRDGLVCEMTRMLDTAAFDQAYQGVDKSSSHLVVNFYEEAPDIEVNQDGAGITLANWNEPANRYWAYRHIKDLVPFSYTLSRGDNPVSEFGSAPADLSQAGTFCRGYDMGLEDYLRSGHCNGIMVLKGNDVVYENFRRMSEEDLHMCQSSSKSTVCAVMGRLVDQGLIDLQQTVDHYLPDIGHAYTGATLQAVMDMNVSVNFNEDFSDPDCDLEPYDRRCGLFPDQDGDWDKGMLDYLQGMTRNETDTMEDGFARYVSTSTDVLGCVIEKVMGKTFAQVFEEEIYQRLGAEADAVFVTDSKGATVCNGGLSLRLRDFARYAQLYANKGKAASGEQVISEAWIDECLQLGKGPAYFVPGVQYHNQITTNGEALSHLGIAGQGFYANPKTGVVIAVFGTLTGPAGGDLDGGIAFYELASSINSLLA